MRHVWQYIATFIVVVHASALNDSSWWRHGVIYQIYPRSFQDGCDVNNTCSGTGTIYGIEQRLDYLNDLGVTCIWISPIYDSPMADFGYDISNYTAIWPTFGTMKAFESMLEKAKSLGLRVLLDLVPNHSSDQHPWFLSSKSSRDSEYRDWYIWADPAFNATTGERIPPTNWKTIFCQDPQCSAWQWDESSGQYYYHQFLPEQPDLNWRNPKVKEAMYDMIRFWLGKGIDGFRVDAFAYLFESESLVDEPLQTHKVSHDGGGFAAGYRSVISNCTENVPPLYEQIVNLSDVTKSFGSDRVLVGEVYSDPPVLTDADVLSFYGTHEKQALDMPFNFILIGVFQSGFKNDRNATELRRRLQDYYDQLPPWAQPNNVLGNHDNPRLATRIGQKLALVAETVLLTLRGTPTLYYGDELGMTDTVVPDENRQDPATPSRDPERIPMPWTHNEPNGGFTGEDTHPWLPIWPGVRNQSVDLQLSDPCSALNLHRWLLRIRKREPALNRGSQTFLEIGNLPHVLAFQRSPPASSASRSCYTIIANFGEDQTQIRWEEDFTHCRNSTTTSVRIIGTSRCAGISAAVPKSIVAGDTLSISAEEVIVIEHKLVSNRYKCINGRCQLSEDEIGLALAECSTFCVSSTHKTNEDSTIDTGTKAATVTSIVIAIVAIIGMAVLIFRYHCNRSRERTYQHLANLDDEDSEDDSTL